ncbi:MAG: MFS transporter [Thermodesulfobacteriota bacterium]
MTHRQSLPKSVVKLGWISFFTDVASEMVYPVVPIFLTVALGAPVVVLGAVEGMAEAIVSVMKGLSGWHCDRIGRRVPYIRWGYGLGAASKPLMALAFAWPMVFLARAVDRLGKGLRTTARDALIADAVDASQGGRAYGFHRMMDTSGAIVGVLIALGLLALLPGQYRLIFLLAALPGAAAVLLTFRLRDVARQPATDACPDAGPDASPDAAATRPVAPGRPWSGLPAAYWKTLGLLLVFAFANSSDTLLILRAKNLGLSDVQAILGYVLFNAVYAASAYPLGILSDRFGRWRMVISGWILYALVYFGFAMADARAVWWLFPMYGLFMGLTEGVGRALIRDKIPEEKKGTAMGIFHMSIGFTMLAGSVTAGLLWDVVGPKAPFVLGGSVALAAVMLALLLRPKAALGNRT